MFESSSRPRRNYRGRKDDSDDEKNGDTDNATAKIPVQTARPQPPKMSTLSFGDDLETGEEFKIKKSAYNRRIVKQLKEGKQPLRFADEISEKHPAEKTVKQEATEKVASSPSLFIPAVNAADDGVDDSDIPTVKPLNRTSSEQFSSILKRTFFAVFFYKFWIYWYYIPSVFIDGPLFKVRRSSSHQPPKIRRYAVTVIGLN
ncbi:unnamed protein product [Dibothriocephalus latus]|uniref:Uncharacterized protein n=1 Tax=Dibothriocephalus latus TaxID=60516 RepID=A0A3P7NY70_DIBLA|nr:unnamed protein product [Dibothriocephalus latus]